MISRQKIDKENLLAMTLVIFLTVALAVSSERVSAQNAPDKSSAEENWKQAWQDAGAAKKALDHAQEDVEKAYKEGEKTMSAEGKAAWEEAKKDVEKAKVAEDKADLDEQIAHDVLENGYSPEKAKAYEKAAHALKEADDKVERAEDAADQVRWHYMSNEACRKISNTISEKRAAKEKFEEKEKAFKKADEELDKEKEKNKKKEEPKPKDETHSTLPRGDGTSVAALIQSGQLACTTIGTGETTGHVANLKIENHTDQPVNCYLPAMILESSSKEGQDYACLGAQNMKIPPHGTATAKLNGFCITRNKPPVGKDVTGDLIINTGDPSLPPNPNSHLSPKDTNTLLRICTSISDAAKKIQKQGGFKNMPYHDPQEQLKIAEQWTAWCDPRISRITGAPPATKDDLRKVVYKQLEAKGPLTPETKKKVDQGINAIFEEGVELITKKAKDLEKPEEESTPGEGGNSPPPGTANVSDEREGVPSAQGTPPQTQTAPSQPAGTPPGQQPPQPKQPEQPPPPVNYGPQLRVAPDAWKQQPAPPKTKEKDPAVQNWLDKRKAANDAASDGFWKAARYRKGLGKFIHDHKYHQELEESLTKEKDPQKRDELGKMLKQLNNELQKDFDATPDGKKLAQEFHDAEKAAGKANAEEEEAGKDIDEKVKKAEAKEQDAQEEAAKKAHK